MSTQESTGTIVVYADYVCPFCYLGRKSLETYQSTRSSPLRIEWHPFDLRANKRSPDGTIDRSVDDGKDEAYFERAKQNVRRLRDEYDVTMTRELATDVDSFTAQLASYHVQHHYSYDEWLAFDTAIYEALWQDEADIGTPRVLVELGEQTGIPAADLRSALSDETLREELTDRFDEAYEAGVTGVPTFVYDGRVARGAVPPAHLDRLIDGSSSP